VSRLKHREFPESTYGYVAFRADKADGARFGRHIYSTSYHDLDEMRDRRKSFRANPNVASPLLVARFELVNVESWELFR
jgi:hypothetical protein